VAHKDALVQYMVLFIVVSVPMNLEVRCDACDGEGLLREGKSLGLVEKP
jgi:hypothetical protein